jgi:hypothetical protein
MCRDDAGRMNSTRIYELGRAGELAAERPSMGDLQRARVRALRSGDSRRAAAYSLLVERRLRAAQRAAEAA